MKLISLLNQKGKNYFYIMHLSYGGAEREPLWKCAIEHNIIGLHHRKVWEYDWIKAPEWVKNRISKFWQNQLDIFSKEIENNDTVIILSGWDSILGIAENIGPYKYQKELTSSEQVYGDFFCYTREVQWRKNYDYNKRYKLISPLNGFNNTISKVKKGDKRWTKLVNLDF
jgi:hypothetical protein